MFHLWSDFNPKVIHMFWQDKFDLTNVNNMVFYISGPKILFETTEISTHQNSTQQESNYIYLYTTKFGTLIKIRLNRKFESTEFETTRVNCIYIYICVCEQFLQVYLKISGSFNNLNYFYIFKGFVMAVIVWLWILSVIWTFYLLSHKVILSMTWHWYWYCYIQLIMTLPIKQ
jgi:hypothetical protein